MIINFLISLLLVSVTSNNPTKCEQSFNSADYQKALLFCEKEFNNTHKNVSSDLLLKLITITHERDLNKKNLYYLAQLKDHSEFHESPKLRYEWYRWHGMISFYSNQLELSEQNFFDALSIALMSNNQTWIAKSNNDLGVLATRKQDFLNALIFYQKSLDINLEENNDYLAGKAYSNMGVVYQEIEKFDDAIRHYRLALDAHLNYKKSLNYDRSVLKIIEHTYESLLQISLTTKNDKDTEYYAKMLVDNSTGQTIDREKIPSLVNFAALYLNQEQIDLANYFLEKAYKLSQQRNNYFMNEIEYQFALLYRQKEEIELATDKALNGLSLTEENNYIAFAKFYSLLSELTENDPERSLAYIKQHQFYREKLLAQKYNTDISTIQHNTEKKIIISDLENERKNRASSEQKVKFLSSRYNAAATGLIILSAITVLFYFLKRKEKAVLIGEIENQKQVLTANICKINDEVSNETHENIDKDSIYEYLVKTMTTAVSIWEKTTSTNRTELADQSGIWTVSNDDGTLRTRSLDKYLFIDKIPQNPRWRNVVETCHFIVSNNNISPNDEKTLKQYSTNISNYFHKLNNDTSTK